MNLRLIIVVLASVIQIPAMAAGPESPIGVIIKDGHIQADPAHPIKFSSLAAEAETLRAQLGELGVAQDDFLRSEREMLSQGRDATPTLRNLVEAKGLKIERLQKAITTTRYSGLEARAGFTKELDATLSAMDQSRKAKSNLARSSALKLSADQIAHDRFAVNQTEELTWKTIKAFDEGTLRPVIKAGTAETQAATLRALESAKALKSTRASFIRMAGAGAAGAAAYGLYEYIYGSSDVDSKLNLDDEALRNDLAAQSNAEINSAAGSTAVGSHVTSNAAAQ